MDARRLLILSLIVWLIIPGIAKAANRYNLTDLGTLDGDYIYSKALAVNESGWVVGYSSNAGGSQHAFLYDGTMHDLGTFGGVNSCAYGINDDGVIVGGAFCSEAVHAFLYDGVLHDLGLLDVTWNTDPEWIIVGELSSYACAVNNSGQVVGFSDVPLSERAFLYDGTMHDLGTLPNGSDSYALSINDNGLVVGLALTDDYEARAFLYDGTAMIDLNDLIDPTLGWTVWEADGISNNGQIVGYGKNALGMTHAFLLTPVPEPSSAAGLGTALLSLGGVMGVGRRR